MNEMASKILLLNFVAWGSYVRVTTTIARIDYTAQYITTIRQDIKTDFQQDNLGTQSTIFTLVLKKILTKFVISKPMIIVQMSFKDILIA